MAVPRPLLLALVAAFLLAATVYAAQGARKTADTTGAGSADAPAPTPLKPVKPPKAAPAKPSARAPKSKPSTPPRAQHPERKAARRERSGSAAPPKPGPPQGAAARRPHAAAAPGLPARVNRALKAKKVVVLFFRQRRGADDTATAAAVRSLRRRRGVAVFSDGIDDLAKYRRVVSALGITQAPAVVIVDRKGEAELAQGFLDEGTLNQLVVDAR
jgi:hypothetical protein